MGKRRGGWLDGAVWAVHIYFILIASRVRSQMQYKVSFVADLLGNMIGTGVDFAALALIFGHVRAVAGWDLAEVAILYGLTTLSFACAELIGAGFDEFPKFVRQGRFDTLMVRPVGVFSQVLANDFVLKRLGRLAQGLAVMVVAIEAKGLHLAPWQWAVMVGAVACGTLCYMALFMVQAASCFWTVESLEAFNLLTYGGSEMITWPVDIYPVWLRRFFTFVVPLVFINYLPARLILGKGAGVAGGGLTGAGSVATAAAATPTIATAATTTATTLAPWTGWLAPLVGVVVFLLARRVWDFGVRHYQSTGS